MSIAKKIIIAYITISLFPSFLIGLSHIKKDATNLYCFILKSCNYDQ